MLTSVIIIQLCKFSKAFPMVQKMLHKLKQELLDLLNPTSPKVLSPSTSENNLFEDKPSIR